MTKADVIEYQRAMLEKCLQEEQQLHLDAKVKTFRGDFFAIKSGHLMFFQEQLAKLQQQMANADLSNADKWIAERKTFNNCLDCYDKVAYTAQSTKYLQSRLQSLQAVQQRVKSPILCALRHSEEMNAFREMQKVDRSRSTGLAKKIDDRLAMGRSQFKKRSFRVSHNSQSFQAQYNLTTVKKLR